MAITATQKVITLEYWKSADKLKVGDKVFNKDGKIVTVKLVQQYFSEDCYEIIFDDHLTMQGDKHLGFLIENPKYRQRIKEYKGVRKQFKRPLKFTRVEDLLDLPLKDKRSRSNYSIPTTKPIEFPFQYLPIPPFLFGFWLFNKNTKNIFLPPKGYSKVVQQKFKDHGYKVIEGKFGRNGEHYFKTDPKIELQLAPNIPTKIPTNYLMASVEERIELLSGIIHAKTRQYSLNTDTFRFTSYHYGTVVQIQSLVESLGSRTLIEQDPTYKYYTLYFKHRIKLVEHQRSPPVKVHYGRRYIKQIKTIQSQMCVHIETDGPDNSILVGEGFISTC